MNSILASVIAALIFITPAGYAQSKSEKNSGNTGSINSTNNIDRDHDNTRDMAKSRMGDMDHNQNHSGDVMEKQSKDPGRNQARSQDNDENADREQDRSNKAASGMASDNKGLTRQQEMKSEQDQKELDKGSEQGMESRAANSRKWWKFWE